MSKKTTEPVATETVAKTTDYPMSDEALIGLYVECREEIKKRGLLKHAQDAYKNK